MHPRYGREEHTQGNVKVGPELGGAVMVRWWWWGGRGDHITCFPDFSQNYCVL